MIRDYQKLDDALVHDIENSGLDIGACYYVMKNVMARVERTYHETIQNELMEELNSRINNESAEENTNDDDDIN